MVDRSSSDGTELVLEQLGGDVRIVKVDASQSLGAAVNEALLLIKSDVLVLVDVTTPFAPAWLRRVQDAISGSAMALLTDIPISQLFAVRVDAMRKLGVFNEKVPDEKIGTDYIERVEFTARRAQKAASFGFPNDMLGKEVGESLGHVLLAGREGAKIGQLSPRYAERLRDRLGQEEERQLLLQARAGRDVCWTDEGIAEPLVTVRVVTYNRADQLMEICLPSVLNQSYENIEVLVVGDHTDEATEKAMQSVTDSRVRFVNLPARPLYPRHAWDRWQVVGSEAMNLAIQLARGSWINPADDDDEMSPDHVEVLLSEAREQRAEFVWSKTVMRSEDGWQVIGTEPMGREVTTHCAVMWSSGLRFMRMSTTSWKFEEEADQNMWRRMHEIGVKMSFVDQVTYRYLPGPR